MKTFPLFFLIISFLFPFTAFPQTIQESDGVQVKIVWERKSLTLSAGAVIPTEQYSLENLKKIWHYFCEKYPDKTLRLNLKIITSDTEEYNRQLEEKQKTEGRNYVLEPGRSWEAEFDRMDFWSSASGGDNELLVYSPDLHYLKDKERVVLAGHDPFGWMTTMDITEWQTAPEIEMVKKHIYYKPEVQSRKSREAPRVRMELIFKSLSDKPVESTTFEILIICHKAGTASELQTLTVKHIIYANKYITNEETAFWYEPSFEDLSLPVKQIVRVSEIIYADGTSWKREKN